MRLKNYFRTYGVDLCQEMWKYQNQQFSSLQNIIYEEAINIEDEIFSLHNTTNKTI